MKNLTDADLKLISGGVYMSICVNNPNAWFIDLGGDSEFRFSPDTKNDFIFNKNGLFHAVQDNKTAITADNMSQYGIKNFAFVGSPDKNINYGVFRIEFC